MPGPAEMSRLPVGSSTTIIPSAPATLGAPALAPTAPIEGPAKTYAPAAAAHHRLLRASAGWRQRKLRQLAASACPRPPRQGRTVDPPHVQGVPPVVNGPSLTPTPAPRPEGSDRVTMQPVIHASYFQPLPPPSATVPAQTATVPAASSNLPADDAGWVHVDASFLDCGGEWHSVPVPAPTNKCCPLKTADQHSASTAEYRALCAVY